MENLFTDPEDNEVGTAEIDDEGRAIVQTTIPGTLEAIASQNERAQAIMASRADVVERLRLWSIKMTDEHDWVLYRRVDDNGMRVITGYLQDQGCRRLASIWGIEDLNVSLPQRVTTEGMGRCKFSHIRSTPDEENPHEGLHVQELTCDGWIEIKGWYYVVSGGARSNFTHGTTETLEGMASGEDDFLKKNRKVGTAAEMWARGAARTRWDGKVVRALSGLGNILIATILPDTPDDAWILSKQAAIWNDQDKDWKRCPTGRGFNYKKKSGGQSSKPPVERAKAVNRPPCPKCKGPMNIKDGWYICAKTGTCSGRVAI